VNCTWPGGIGKEVEIWPGLVDGSPAAGHTLSVYVVLYLTRKDTPVA
jgi:hypothetical protein